MVAEAVVEGRIPVAECPSTQARPTTLGGTEPADDTARGQITEAPGRPSATFGTPTRRAGDEVVTVGHRLGLAQGTPTVTRDRVGALGRTRTAGGDVDPETLSTMIQADAGVARR